MHTKRVIIILVSFLLSIGLLCGASACAAHPTVYLTPADVQVGPGEEFTVEVHVDPMGRGISAVEIDLEFPRGVMAVRSVQPGPLLGPEPVTGVKNIDNRAGMVQYAIARTGPTVTPTEPGTVAAITFLVTASRPIDCTLELTKAGLADEKFEDILNVTVSSTSVSVIAQEQEE